MDRGRGWKGGITFGGHPAQLTANGERLIVAASHVTSNMVGQRFGHYRVLERVGSGAMGVVYRAVDERLDREVAIKVLATGTLDETSRLRLRKEARAISRAVHPAVATVHDLATDGDQDFLVMEFVAGSTLADRIAEGPLEESEVIALGCQLASGLAAAHGAGVVHRDIKPSNLKITPDGRLKILDFGIAQLRPSSNETTRTGTNQGRAVGTIPYMSPEQLRGAQFDPRSDIYSAGAVLYEMATGLRAFPERYELQLMDAVLRRPVAPPRTVKPELSAALETCLLRTLEKDPAVRYQTASDLELALQAVESAGDQSEHSPGFVRRLVRHRRLAWAALVLVIAASAGISREWLRDKPEAAAPAAPAPSPVSGTRLRLAVLPPQNLTNRAAFDDWLPILQSLFTSELTGVQDLGIVDPLSLNGRLASARSPAQREQRLATALKELGINLTVDPRLVPAGSGTQLQASVIDPHSAEVRFIARASVSSEADLGAAVRNATEAVVSYLQLKVFKLADTPDMRPWITLRERNVEAVKLFVQANQYIYRFQSAGVEPLLRRAIALDPAFVGPRLWLYSVLLQRGERQEAEQHYAELKKLEPTATPFDQAMIAYAGAMRADDDPAQVRSLELALEYSPANNILLINLAAARARTGDFAGALRDVQPAVEMRWEYPPVYSLAGSCAIQLGDFAEARRVLKIGAELRVVDPYVFALLAGLEAAFGRQADADRLFATYVLRRKELNLPVGDPVIAKVYEALAQDAEARREPARAARLDEMRDGMLRAATGQSR